MYEIRTPGELKKAIRIIAANLDDGTIRLSEYWPKGILKCCDSGSFSELANGHDWGDIIEYYFECPQCRSLFHLEAETYHGRGGRWSPAERENGF